MSSKFFSKTHRQLVTNVNSPPAFAQYQRQVYLSRVRYLACALSGLPYDQGGGLENRLKIYQKSAVQQCRPRPTIEDTPSLLAIFICRQPIRQRQDWKLREKPFSMQPFEFTHDSQLSTSLTGHCALSIALSSTIVIMAVFMILTDLGQRPIMMK